MMTRRERRAAKARKEGLLTIAAIILIPVFFYGMFEWFRIVDCNTATDNLQFLNDCIESEHCNLRPRELQQIETYTRLQLARCPKD